jgi:hypothetical protein
VEVETAGIAVAAAEKMRAVALGVTRATTTMRALQVSAARVRVRVRTGAQEDKAETLATTRALAATAPRRRRTVRATAA